LVIIHRRRTSSNHADWDNNQWQTFALEQFFREDDEVELSFNPANFQYFFYSIAIFNSALLPNSCGMKLGGYHLVVQPIWEGCHVFRLT
jgi:hypothetical protein